MRQTMFLCFALAILWLSNSGHYTPLIMGLGVLSVAFVVWIVRKMDIHKQQVYSMVLLSRLPAYWLWLFKEIVLSNIDVVKRIVLGVDSIDPVTATLPLPHKTDIAQVIYANSITLTPGTVTLELENGELVIHALTNEAVETLQQGEMERRVKHLEC